MRKFATIRGRSIAIATFIITLLIAIQLLLNNQIYLLAAVICGYFTAMYYVFMLATRIKKSMLLSPSAAKRSAQTGMVLRIIFLILFSLLIIKFAKDFFIAFIAGFFIMHIIVFINLIIFSYQEKIH
ncbi:ATP synthase subunit I [Pectinatus cerevisiiphilus]|uniref:ATP synthase I subunit n=1 Tax=Pectinatus cerevisiiphilus TaxID=86956 RepID=A0A4R3KBR5_9FIRM|nr:hypothetical protein [Pectinatus cerevisiiphilus]TCS80517.1 hypothetical protein EDC37_104119 [Pectinatus cerevisiiphilus]